MWCRKVSYEGISANILKGCELDTPAIDPTMPTRQLMRSASGMPGVVRQESEGQWTDVDRQQWEAQGIVDVDGTRDSVDGRPGGHRALEIWSQPVIAVVGCLGSQDGWDRAQGEGRLSGEVDSEWTGRWGWRRRRQLTCSLRWGDHHRRSLPQRTDSRRGRMERVRSR